MRPAIGQGHYSLLAVCERDSTLFQFSKPFRKVGHQLRGYFTDASLWFADSRDGYRVLVLAIACAHLILKSPAQSVFSVSCLTHPEWCELREQSCLVFRSLFQDRLRQPAVPER